MLHRLIANLPEPRDVFRQLLSHCLSTNPRSVRWIVAQMALYLHLGPFSRYVIGEIGHKIDGLDIDASAAPLKAKSPQPALSA